MNTNPADAIKNAMWDFVKTGYQTGDPQALKTAVYELVGMATQKDGGQRPDSKGLPFELLDMVKWKIIVEASALVLSGQIDRLIDDTAVASGGENI